MRRSQRGRKAQIALGNIRFLAPDIEPIRKDVKFVHDYIVWLEEEVAALRRALEEKQSGDHGE